MREDLSAYGDKTPAAHRRGRSTAQWRVLIALTLALPLGLLCARSASGALSGLSYDVV